MNYMDDEHVCCAYPEWTANQVGLWNPLVRRNLLRNVKREAEALSKYATRGFIIKTAFDEKELGTHRCGTSVYCPHTQRATNDDGMLRVTFRKDVGPVREYKASMAYATWRLGGKACVEDGVVAPSYAAACTCVRHY